MKYGIESYLKAMLTVVICCASVFGAGCSSKKSIEGERYRQMNALLKNPATRFDNLKAYADGVASQTTDPDVKTVAEYTSASAEAAMLLNYTTVGQADNTSGIAEFGRTVFAFVAKQREYSQVFHKGMAIDEEQVKAAEARCNRKYL